MTPRAMSFSIVSERVATTACGAGTKFHKPSFAALCQDTMASTPVFDGLCPAMTLQTALSSSAEQLVEECERVLRLAAFDAAQDVLVRLVGRHVALGILRRRNVGDAALVAVQDGMDARVEAVEVLVDM